MTGYIKTWAHDFIYIPQTRAEDYVTVSRFFMKQRAMIEVATNVLQYGLADEGSLLLIDGGNLWGWPRLNPGPSFNETHYYLHPFKLGSPDQKQNGDNWTFYCRVYLRKLFSALKSRS